MSDLNIDYEAAFQTFYEQTDGREGATWMDLAGSVKRALASAVDDALPKPCVHGNYARHPIESTVKVVSSLANGVVKKAAITYVMCDGKPEGDSV